MIETGYYQVLMAAVLVLVAFILARLKSIPLEKEIGFGAIRAFIQLVAVGYALEFIFNSQSIWLLLLSVTVMLVVGAYTAGKRAEHFKNGFKISMFAITIGSLGTLGLMLALQIISAEARYIIPLSGMIISNSMNATSVAFNRIGADLKSSRSAIETALSLGKSWREASRPYYREAVKAGMIFILNFFKTVGIVALPGAMTGMILAGVSPLDAVLIQVIVGYMLLSSVTISAIISTELAIRRFFNISAEQFVG
jgi:putative ABC transport system permease protein